MRGGLAIARSQHSSSSLKTPVCSIPAGMTIFIASWLILDYGAHGGLPGFILRLCILMAKDGEVACAFQPFAGSRLEALIF